MKNSSFIFDQIFFYKIVLQCNALSYKTETKSLDFCHHIIILNEVIINDSTVSTRVGIEGNGWYVVL